MARTVEAWCCGVAADHELGKTNVHIHESKEAVLEREACSRLDPSCAPVRLTITIHDREEA
jgi:hypothetical protein